MAKCIFCGDRCKNNHVASAFDGMSGDRFDCETCGSFMLGLMDAFFVPDGQQNQTPSMLAAFKHGLATAQSKVTDPTSEIVYVWITNLTQDDEAKIRTFVEANSKFPDDVISAGFTVRKVGKCPTCGDGHLYK